MDHDDDEVGYGRPPKHTRFKPGQSGNPRGRPKGARNLKTELDEEMNETIKLRENGRERRISKRRAIIKTLVSKTLKGDVRAANTLLNMMMRLADDREPTAEFDGLVEEDKAIVERFAQRSGGAANDEHALSSSASPEAGGGNDNDL